MNKEFNKYNREECIEGINKILEKTKELWLLQMIFRTVTLITK